MRAQVREARAQRGGVIRRWFSSQVSGYRLELILGYLALMGFGSTAIRAGIPVFVLSTNDPYAWAVIVGSLITLGGLIAAIGAVRAGEEPVTNFIRRFNWIEIVGTTLLMTAVGGYAVVLMFYGFVYDDLGRQTIGSAMVALAIRPTVRLVWLIFRPGVIHTTRAGAWLGKHSRRIFGGKVSDGGTPAAGAKGDQEP